jgi:hypothetical protein
VWYVEFRAEFRNLRLQIPLTIKHTEYRLNQDKNLVMILTRFNFLRDYLISISSTSNNKVASAPIVGPLPLGP